MCHKYLDCACVFITLAESVTGAAHTRQQHLMLGKSFPSPHMDQTAARRKQNMHRGPVAASSLPLSPPATLVNNNNNNNMNVLSCSYRAAARKDAGKKSCGCD